MGSRRAATEAWEALFRAQVSVMRHLTAAFPMHGISFNEYDVLFNLSLLEGHRARLKDLNRHLLLTQPSVSRLIDRLASRGIVWKQADPDDARGVVVGLTDSGYGVFRTVARVHVESIAERVGSALDDDELHQLAILSDKLRSGGAG